MQGGVIKRRVYEDERLQQLINEEVLGERLGPDTLDVLVERGVIGPLLDGEDVEFLNRFGILRPAVELTGGELRAGDTSAPADLGRRENRRLVASRMMGERLEGGKLVYAGFFLGPESFYRQLRGMPEEQRRRIRMTSVLNVNHLFESGYLTERLKVLQRRHARFINACMMVTLSGAVVSDGLEDCRIVSGVGGQYNFVSQAHELEGARSILMCRATRTKGRQVLSNVVYSYGHTTIPRHLRDMVVTEYGIADLRGKSDREVVAALLNIADSRFQSELLQRAKEARKIAADYTIPDRFRHNTPERLADATRQLRREGVFPPFPFGTDFTREEIVLG
ncbi:MAG: acetyl-CoA hydrolase, partial [Deltaproteobacteria bacterium]